MQSKGEVSVFWFRRDLRLSDNVGLALALKSGHPVQCLFIFDKDILEKLENKDDARVTFIHDTLTELHADLQEHGSSLTVRYGKPAEVWKSLNREWKITSVFANEDYEPYAISRDNAIKALLQKENIPFFLSKDHVVFRGTEILKKDETPYCVFTPYSKKWKAEIRNSGGIKSKHLQIAPSHSLLDRFHQCEPEPIISLKSMGFTRSSLTIPTKVVPRKRIKEYTDKRNFPAINGTSKLGIHFRFGTISIRDKARNALQLNETFLNELIWRDFYSMILFHFPRVVKGPFREKYNRIPWRTSEKDFAAWCKGKTGYPIVDAGMRELNATGFMHNRVRMITASFLTKHLLLDWKLGEAYFAEKLLDFDLASNSGGWQWAAGCGTDAAPYFRIFNPESQQKKFDKNFAYINKWIPEFGTPAYPEPIVDHKFARERCLSTYKAALNTT